MLPFLFLLFQLQLPANFATCVSCGIGTYISPDGFSLSRPCIECPSGTWSDKFNATSCKLCAPGKYGSESGAIVCKLCLPGKRNHRTGQTQCQICAPGRFSSTTASSAVTCQSCQTGFYSDKAGQLFCHGCEVGMYTAANASIACSSCPLGRVSVIYDGQYYATSKKAVDCVVCRDGNIPNEKRTGCVRPPWFTAKDCERGMEYFANHDQNPMNHTCRPCPIGLNCSVVCCGLLECVPKDGCQNNLCSTCIPKDGFWRIPAEFISSTPNRPEFKKCPFPKDCKWRPAFNTSCAENTTGNLCSTCVVGWDRIGAKCKVCREGEIYIRLLILLSFIAIVCGILFRLRKRIVQFHQKYGSAWRDAMLVVKIFINFSQINTSMPNMLPFFEFPTVYLDFLSTFNVLDVDLLGALGFQCAVELDYRFSVATAMIVPMLIVLISYVGYSVQKYTLNSDIEEFSVRKRADALAALFDLYDVDRSGCIDREEFGHLVHVCSHRTNLLLNEEEVTILMANAADEVPHSDLELKREDFFRALMSRGEGDLGSVISKEIAIHHVKVHELGMSYISACVQLLLLFHAPLSAKGFLYFDCMPIGTERYFLRKDFQLECGSVIYSSFLIMPLVLVVGFAFSVPLLLGSYIFVHRNNLHAPATRQRIGFLYPRYQPGTEGWEIFEVVRKLCLTGLLIFLPPHFRIAVAILLCVLAACLLNYYQPHINRLIFWMCNVSYLVTAMKYVAATFESIQNTNELSEMDDLSMGWLLIILDVSVMVGSVAVGIGAFVVMRRRIHKLDELAKTQKRKSVFAKELLGVSDMSQFENEEAVLGMKAVIDTIRATHSTARESRRSHNRFLAPENMFNLPKRRSKLSKKQGSSPSKAERLSKQASRRNLLVKVVPRFDKQQSHSYIMNSGSQEVAEDVKEEAALVVEEDATKKLKVAKSKQ